ncbi:26S proteasome non-ATPase regulatory subunit 10 [Aphelenchoides fujianensis]|nr:26S proteasome non-ATPase regulatory subunit 10 [Aphelenchoides fujianensis]
MIASGDKKELREKHADLVEFLRNNLPDGAKKLVVETPALMHFQDESGRLPIHWAATGGCLPFVELAISQEPELAAKSDDAGWTPLMIAVSAGRFDVARFLLTRTECDVNHQENNNGQVSLHYACSKNNAKITKLLLENGAEVNVADKYGNTPLHRAASQGHMEVLQLLCAQPGIRVDLPDREGNTPLQLAVEDLHESAAIFPRAPRGGRQPAEQSGEVAARFGPKRHAQEAQGRGR